MLNKVVYDETRVSVVVAPIALHLGSVKALVNQNIHVASQNVSATSFGAYTGEIAAE